MKKFNLDFKVTNILKEPRSEWKEFVAFSRGRNVRTAFRDLDVDWKKYNTKDYLFTHDTIVCSVETEDNGYWITKPCEELVNANGNAWTNKVLLNSFRTFIGGENFLEHCFVEGTRVLMSDGTYKNIEEIVIGDKIINAKGEVDTVVNTMNRLYSGKMVEISDKNILSKKIVCTSNHPFYVYQDKCVSAISQKQIKPQNKKSRLHYDDFGFAPGEHPTQNEKFVSRWGEPQYIESQYLDNAKTALIHPVPLNVVECDEINENRAFLIGWFLAEGSYTTAGGIQFSLSDKEIDVAEKIVSLLEIEFPEKNMRGSFNSKDLKSFAEKAPVKTAQIRKYNNPKTGNPSYLTVLYCSKIAAAFFRKWCNEYSWAKCLPEEAMFLPLELQKTILIEYINGDGCKRRKSRGASVDSKSKKLIQQMRFIAIRLGTFPLYRETGVLKRYSIESIREGYPVFIEPNTGKLSRHGYSLCFSCEDWYKLYGGEKPKHSSHSVKFGNNFVFRFNKKQEFETTGTTVFNIETQNDHSYIVEGVAVHNCQIFSLSKGKILDAIIRPVVHTNKYGSANIYFCFTGENKVWCENGKWKRIDELKEGDLVYNKYGELTKVVAINKSKKEHFIGVKCSGVVDELVSDSEHPYLVLDENENETWVKAEDLKEGMKLFTPFIVHNGKKHIDKELAWFVGFYMAEGSLVSRNKKNYSCIQLSINKSEIDTVVDNVKKVLDIVGNYKVPFFTQRYSKEKLYRTVSGYYDYHYNKTGNGVTIRINHRVLAEMCFNLCGKGSYTKYISDEIMNEWDEESIKHFIAGYVDGDGNIRNQRLSVKSASNMIMQQLAVLSMKIHLPYNQSGKWKEGPYSKSISFEFDSNSLISLNDFLRFKNFNGNEIKIGNLNRGVGFCRNGIYRIIRGVRSFSDNNYVFDIQVENGRSFLVNGIVVHNCDILVATNRKHYDLIRRIESGQLNTLSMGACHVDGTQITMYNGLQKNVEDVKIGDKVITGTNKVGIVTNTSRRICSKGELLKISTRYGDTYVTEEHPYLVFNGKENHDELFEQNISMKWIEAGNLKKGNWILVPVIETESQKQLDKNYARLLGYYLSEGNLHYYNGVPCAVEINFNINEKNYIDEVVFCAKNLGIEPYVQERKEKSITRIVLRSKELSKWMFDNGGILSYSKKISDSIFEYGRETFLNILGAYINGDGCGKQDRLSFCTVSKDMAEQLFLMTKMCGIPCTLQKAIKHRINERDSYTVNICNGYASSFMGYSDKANNLKTKQENKKINGYILVKIHSIDRIDLSVPVNNLTVEGEHTYLANGFVVHNCANVTQCSICGKVFKDENEEVCEHLKHHIGGYCKCSDGKSRICAEFVGACDENGEYIPDSCQFIEASWVEHPAFKGAVVNSFVETEEERQLRESSQDELKKLFEESLFERLKVADTPTAIALKITKVYAKAERMSKIAEKIAKKDSKHD